MTKKPPMVGRTLRFPAEMLEYLEREARAYGTDVAEIVRQHIRKTRREVIAGEPLFEKERLRGEVSSGSPGTGVSPEPGGLTPGGRVKTARPKKAS